MNELIHLKLTVAELNLALEALGGQPYYKVYELIARLQTQAQEQLQPATGSSTASKGELKPVIQNSNGVSAGE